MATRQGTGTGRPSLITRSFDAPRNLIFKAWTDPEYFKHWWGPKGSTMGTCKMDLRPGGTLLYSMRMPGEVEMWGKFVYREILPPDRLVFVSSFSAENGNVTRAPFTATWPLEILNTLTLREQFGEATLTFLGSPVNATEEEWATFEASLAAMHESFSGTFDRLAEYLAKV